MTTSWRIAWTLSVACVAACEAAPVAEETVRSSWRERIELVEPKPAELVRLTTLPAEVVLPPEARLVMRPRSEGHVVAWRVQLGDAVEVGTPLADLASAELTDLAAQARALEEVVTERERIVEAKQRQVESGMAATPVLDDALAALREARASRDQLRRQLGGRGAFSPSGSPGVWTWKSTMSGHLESLGCGGESGACATIVTPEAAWVEVHVPERYFSSRAEFTLRFLAGSRASEQLALGAPEPPLGAPRCAPTVRSPSRTFVCRFAASTPLVPGSSGRGELFVPADPGSFVVPDDAVTRLDAGRVVFVVRGDAPPTAVPVELMGYAPEGRVVRGALATERVVSRGVFLAKSLALIGAN